MLLGGAVSGCIALCEVLDGASTPSGETSAPAPASLRMAGRLLGHSGRVTCLAASQAFATAVSGAVDGQALLWDLQRLVCTRRLLVGDLWSAPTAAAVSERSGTILIAAGTQLWWCDVNGDVLGKGEAGEEGDSILCVAVCEEHHWWAGSRVALTGHASGCVRLWRLEPAPTQGREPWRLVVVVERKVHAAAVTAVHISGDLRQAFSGDVSGYVYTWEPDTTA